MGLAVICLGALPAPAAVVAADGATSIGTSARGREIVAIRRAGSAATKVKLVVIGVIHGNEPAGARVVAELMGSELPDGMELWLVPSANPDGSAAGTRTNANGVDLNRNFPDRWRRSARGSTYSGPRRASEPETRALMEFLEQTRPDATVILHQDLYGVDTSVPGTKRLARLLARQTGLPLKAFRCSGTCHGTLTGWARQALPGPAITVELNARPSEALVRRVASGTIAAAMALGPA